MSTRAVVILGGRVDSVDDGHKREGDKWILRRLFERGRGGTATSIIYVPGSTMVILVGSREGTLEDSKVHRASSSLLLLPLLMLPLLLLLLLRLVLVCEVTWSVPQYRLDGGTA